MGFKRIGLLFICFFVIALPVRYTYAASSNNSFKIFDGTLYTGKPDLSVYCIHRLKIIYHNDLWSKGENDSNLPALKGNNSLVERLNLSNAGYAVIDIEHWSLDKGSARTENLKKYVAVARSFKEMFPTLKFGFYDLPPIDAALTTPVRRLLSRAIWQKQNDALVPLFSFTQAVFPALYTIFEDENRWVQFSREKISEAKRLGNGKPVFVFLWPQYHMLVGSKKFQFLDKAIWRRQLEFVKANADGVVIWGGWSDNDHKAMVWSESAGWWLETKAFIRDLYEGGGSTLKCETDNF